MMGIGLGGFATGFERGIGIGKKLAGTPEEQRQRRAEGATEEARKEFDANGGGSLEQFQSYLIPKVASKHIAAGDIDGARTWQDWAKQEEIRAATKQFGQGMIAAQAGDTRGALDAFVKAGRTRGYGGDYTIGEPEPVDGGGWRVSITGKDGVARAKEFRSPDEVLKFGAAYLNPEAAFQQWQAQQSDAAKRKNDLADDAAKYSTRKKIDQDAAPAENASFLERFSGQKRIETENEQKKRELGLGQANYELQVRPEIDAEGKPVVRSYKFDKRSGRLEPVEGEGAFEKPGRAGGGGKRFQFEVVRDAYKNLGYSDQDATDIASGRKPPRDTELLSVARQMTNMEMPSSDMRYKAEQRKKRYEEILNGLREQYKTGPRSEPAAAPGLGPRSQQQPDSQSVRPALAGAPAPRDPAQRKVGEVYTAPDGRNVKWTGQGWLVVP
jgi:hypothetical protein